MMSPSQVAEAESSSSLLVADCAFRMPRAQSWMAMGISLSSEKMKKG
jgi:hypothetical protein